MMHLTLMKLDYQFFNTNGTTDEVVNASLSDDDFKEYEYTGW